MFYLSNRKIEKLSDLLEKIKFIDNNNDLEDLITEIENKIILGKQILEYPENAKEKLDKYIENEDEDDTPKMSKKCFNKVLCTN